LGCLDLGYGFGKGTSDGEIELVTEGGKINILKLTVSEDFQLRDPEGRKIRWFEYNPEGRDVEISGVFSIEIEKLPLDGHFRDKPQVRVESVTRLLP
jgi:hypothetical protein